METGIGFFEFVREFELFLIFFFFGLFLRGTSYDFFVFFKMNLGKWGESTRDLSAFLVFFLWEAIRGFLRFFVFVWVSRCVWAIFQDEFLFYWLFLNLASLSACYALTFILFSRSWYFDFFYLALYWSFKLGVYGNRGFLPEIDLEIEFSGIFLFPCFHDFFYFCCADFHFSPWLLLTKWPWYLGFFLEYTDFYFLVFSIHFYFFCVYFLLVFIFLCD